MRSVLIAVVITAGAAGLSLSAAGTGPTTAPSMLDRQHAADLSRRASDLIDQHKLVEAEATLRQSLAIIPDNPTRLYNLACVLVAQGKRGAGMDALEHATDAGFTDFTYLEQDATLDSLRDMPQFRAMLEHKGEIRHHAAERALAQLKAEFDESYRFDSDEEMKLVFATSLDEQTLKTLKHDLQVQAKSQWEQIFAHRSDEFIRVIVPSSADFRRLVPMSHVGGRYDDDTRTVIVQHLGQFMAHEFTHALHAADQHAVGQEHAVWVGEGLASLYEAAVEANGALVPRENARFTVVRLAARRHTLIPLDGLVKMSRESFGGRAALAYGESSALMLYLFDKGLLRKFYENYKTTWSDDPSGKTALEQTTGMLLPQLQKAWADWVIARPVSADLTRTNGPMIGVRLAEEVDGLRVTEVMAGSPASRADLRINDLIVSIDEKEARDRTTFNTTLAGHQPGDEVTLQVRRGSNYIAIAVVLSKREPAASR